VARSRHSLKLFEDTKRGVNGQLAYFRDVLMPAHRGRFLGSVRFKVFRFLETDLGLYRYNGRLISTTHAANFHMGQDPQAILIKSGADIQAIYQEYGHFVATLGGRRGTPGQTFVSHLDARKFNSHVENLRAAGAPVPPVMGAEWDATSGYRWGERIAGRDDVTAVFCGNDEIALGLMRALSDRGLSVPGNVSVVGFDDQPLVALWRPSLTTVDQDFEDLGARAFHLLSRLVNGDTNVPTSVATPQLVVRESTAPPRG
jgi:hypothetical protein